MLNAIQTFSMSDEQVTIRLKTIGKAPHELLLSVGVEVDHYVSTKNERKRTEMRETLDQILPAKFDKVTNLRSYAERSISRSGFADIVPDLLK